MIALPEDFENVIDELRSFNWKQKRAISLITKKAYNRGWNDYKKQNANDSGGEHE